MNWRRAHEHEQRYALIETLPTAKGPDPKVLPVSLYPSTSIQEFRVEDGCGREGEGIMRAGTGQWKRLQQLGRVFTASHIPPARHQITATIVSWSNSLHRESKYPTLPSDSKSCYSRHISSVNFEISSTILVHNRPKFYSWNRNQRRFESRTHVSSAQSSEPEYWDTPEDQNTVPQQAPWDHDEQEDLRKATNDRKIERHDDGIDWGLPLQLREREMLQRASLSPNPPPKFQQDDIYIPVKACYISRSVDLKRLSEEPFLEVTTSRNNLIIRFTNRAADAKPTLNRPGSAELSRSQERYMVAFQYGSIVFFNFGDDEEEEALSAVRKFCTDEFRETRKDDYGVLVRPTLSEWSQGGQDRIMLRMLDTDNIRVISSILGQSIALDHYAKKVDEMVNTFSKLNRGMEKTGTFTMTRKSLFQLVAAANTTLADVILRLGLLERSDAAWKNANYAQIWEFLRDDFELDERFESLDFKLNIIQHNVRFFLEILQNRKSDTLEWIIILLIIGEICVGVYQILLETNVL